MRLQVLVTTAWLAAFSLVLFQTPIRRLAEAVKHDDAPPPAVGPSTLAAGDIPARPRS